MLSNNRKREKEKEKERIVSLLSYSSVSCLIFSPSSLPLIAFSISLLFLSPLFSLSFYFAVCHSFFLSFFLSVFVSLFLSLFLYVFLSLSFFLSLFYSLFLSFFSYSLSLSFFFLSIYLFPTSLLMLAPSLSLLQITLSNYLPYFTTLQS